MTIAPALLRGYPAISDAQRAVVGHVEGPLLVIAGPGSGKTFSLVLRAMNLLLLGKVEPKQLVVCTFTEKAAFELLDRLSAAARNVGYSRDLSDLRVSTIHGLCNRLLVAHRHRTPLGSNYETLDELTQLLFVFEHREKIIGAEVGGRYLGRWSTRWTAIKGICGYFNKITEELVEAERLAESPNPFISNLGRTYLKYRGLLFDNNRLDFGHQQKLVHDLLQDPAHDDAVAGDIKYVLVDEYQDTNYIQEQILLRLSRSTRNLCVAGDEDQSLYRFRGATVRNILEFPTRMPGCETVKLTTNYRSHRRIVQAYDRWMASSDWTNAAGLPFRFDKTICPDAQAEHPEYPAIFCISGNGPSDEAERFADLVAFLKNNEVIADYSQTALLLHSVRADHSGPYLAALESRGIPAFCPRARTYFENDEVRLMVACVALIFGWHGDGRGQIAGGPLADLARYVDGCVVALARAASAPLTVALRGFVADIAALEEGQALDLRPADYFYRLLALEPFASLMKGENAARNLAILSQLLNTFQNYYHYSVVTHRNRVHLRMHLFASFLRLLYEGGINEYDDPKQPLPRGYVQVMTIHQAKGLEFPVVVVGSLDKLLSTQKQVDRDLQPYYHRAPFEPESRITHFDRMRLHYVAFSRPQKVLVLTCDGRTKDHFAPIWNGLPEYPYIQQDLLAAQSFELNGRMPVKRTYSFTGDLKLYETCPRQYQFFREYDFTPSQSAVIFFGLLVHQTIEEIQRRVLDGQLAALTDERIRELFERTFGFLAMTDVRPIGDVAKESAFRQVMDYFRQNQPEMLRVVETEVDVSVEKDNYILTGKVDLLMGSDGRLELLDFKTSPKPRGSTALLHSYERQLCTYAHILEKRYGKRPDRLLLYWTSEPRKADALIEFPYRPELVEDAAWEFDLVVGKIRAKDFRVMVPPEKGVCRNCDIRRLCTNDGTIGRRV